MIQHFSILLTGFSVFAIAVLLIAYLFFLPDMRKSTQGKIACAFLLCSLALLQLTHYHYFSLGTDLISLRGYGMLLMFIPASFFFFVYRRALPLAGCGASYSTDLEFYFTYQMVTTGRIFIRYGIYILVRSTGFYVAWATRALQI